MEENISDHILELIKLKNFDVGAFENIIKWNCRDECKYKCMHMTTKAFIARDWKVPQFHGKWPFMRFIGLQEPASVIFSALNFYVHIKGIARFRQEVQPDAPLFLVWHVFAFICLNAWTWSMVFHARDFPLTELFDYVFAYSMVLASFWCMVKR
jgi:post-GPI attachment to proteins factor 3